MEININTVQVSKASQRFFFSHVGINELSHMTILEQKRKTMFIILARSYGGISSILSNWLVRVMVV